MFFELNEHTKVALKVHLILLLFGSLICAFYLVELPHKISYSVALMLTVPILISEVSYFIFLLNLSQGTTNMPPTFPPCYRPMQTEESLQSEVQELFT